MGKYGEPIEDCLFMKDGKITVRVQRKIPQRRKPLESVKTLTPLSDESFHVFKERARAVRAAIIEGFGCVATGDKDRGHIYISEWAPEVFERPLQKTGQRRAPGTFRKLRSQLKHVLREWGDFYLDLITRRSVEAWHGRLVKDVEQGRMSAHTAHGILACFKHVIHAGSLTFAAYGVQDVAADLLIATAGTEKRSADQPNTLAPAEVARFMLAVWTLAPQHYAQVALGLLTGRRPSELRAITRRGPDADYNAETGVLKIRGAQGRGYDGIGDDAQPTNAANKKTKTGKRLTIHLPPVLVAILRRHIASLTGKAAESDLLFPSARGGYLSEKALDPVITKACAAAGITTRLTAKFMRRTVQDLGRLAHVDRLIISSLTGHAFKGTVAVAAPVATTNDLALPMGDWYSTVFANEQRAGIEAMAALGRVFEGPGLAARGVTAHHTEEVKAAA